MSRRSTVGTAALALFIVTGAALPVAAATGGSPPADASLSTAAGDTADGLGFDPDLGDGSGGNETDDNETDDGSVVGDAVDDDSDAVDNTTDPVAEGTNGTTDTVENATERTTDAVDNATDVVTGGTNGTTDTVENATENTTDAVENTTDAATNGVDGTVDAAGNVTDGATGTVGDAADAVTGSAKGVDDDGIGGATGAVGNGTNATVGATGSATADFSSSDASTGGNDATANGSTADSPDVGDDSDSASADGTSGADPVASDGESAPNDDGSSSESGNSGWIPLTGAAAGAVVVTAFGAAAIEGTLRPTEALALGGGRVRASATEAVRTSGTAVRSWIRSGRDRLWRLAVLFRYSRYDDSDPLEHDCRRAVYEAIEEVPGTYLSEVETRTEASLSTVRHHLRILEEEGLVTERKLRGKRRYFPVGRDGDGEDPALVAALDDPATESILGTLAEVGPASGGRLAEELDRDPSTVSHHLSRLADDGLVERERDGRAVVNDLAGAAERTLREDRVETETAGQLSPADD